jgi:FixJ family two-component response regulator
VRLPACTILDVHMRGLFGLDVQSRLRASHIELPVVFTISGDDLALDQTVVAAGGVRPLCKPFSNGELLEAVAMALQSEQRDPT